MARARAEADLSIFLAKTFCDTTFFSSLDDFCIVDEKRQESLGLRDLFFLSIRGRVRSPK
jgi:hypothetical protein